MKRGIAMVVWGSDGKLEIALLLLLLLHGASAGHGTGFEGDAEMLRC
jgi:hypothetical protein